MSFLGLFQKKNPDLEAFKILHKAREHAERVARRNGEWVRRTGRPSEERPGFGEDVALHEAFYQQAAAVRAEGNAEFKAEFARQRRPR